MQESFGNYRDGYRHHRAAESEAANTEMEPKGGAAKLCRCGGRHKTLVASYSVVAMFGLGCHLINAAYWVLGSLTTSFNAELGSFSLAALYIAFIVSFLIAPTLVNFLGAKTCSVLSGLCILVFTASYFYPSWYTIMPSSVVQGFGYSLMYTTVGVMKNDEVRRVVEKLKVDEATYQGRFTAILTFSLNAAAVAAGVVSVSTLHTQHTFNSSTAYQHNTSDGCVPLSNSTAAAAVNSTSYTILVAVCTGIAFLSLVTFSINRGSVYHQCGVRSLGLKEVVRRVTTHGADFFKQLTTPAYALLIPLRLLHGAGNAYFFGVFTKMYISECIGVEFVGLSVILWGTFAGLGSFSVGWLLRYMAAYVMVVFTIGLGQMGAIVFLITWVRQPSLTAVTIMSAISGVCYGVGSASSLVYTGIAPELTKNTGYSVLVALSATGQSIQFVLSETVTPEVNLYILLTLTALAVPLFSTADLHFGSGSSRHCCKRKRAMEATDPYEQDKKTKGFPGRRESGIATKETAV